MKSDVEWITAPKTGERENGDVVVVRHETNWLLFAVIDALGHGQQAAHAAKAAADLLERVPSSHDVSTILMSLHERLKGTRGAAGLVCIASGERLQACGVGNVEMRCGRPGIPVILTPGIIGSHLKRLRPFACNLQRGDRVIMFSDGISSRFSFADVRDLSPKDACKSIFGRCRREHDDATVLVADLEGAS